MADRMQVLTLCKRTAWMNDRIESNPALRKPQPSDRADLNKALYMLAYLGAIDMALYDLVQELTDAGLYRHALKAQINRTMQIVGNANGRANDTLKVVNNGKRVRQYTEMYEYAYNKIQRHILLEAPERAYNIVRALTRLFTKAYDAVGRRTNHTYLRDAAEALKRIDIPQIADRNIDTIIERAVNIVLPD